VGAEITSKYSRAATDVSNNAEIIAEEIVNDPVFGWLLNRHGIGDEKVI
jgi:hypothetical protein